ncbi:MAG: type I-C CRISPR-associated protein Cas8c/Csd1 [Aquabacterium sp.]|nr:type I-C CRISPR-associated protein Cas8c/Csd1 [Aquabacterium sp.]
MSWLLKLFETYERCAGHEPDGAQKLMPICHTPQQAHLEIALDGAGNFKRAQVISSVETFIPATEKSTSRSGSLVAAHALADKVQYVAKDYPAFGGKEKGHFANFLAQLEEWCESDSTHPKARAVLAYVKKGTVVHDLVAHQVLVARDGLLLTSWDGDGVEPLVFKQLIAKDDGNEKTKDQGGALIRWVVEVAPGDPATDTWTDASLHASWIRFYSNQQTRRGTCAVTGSLASLLASKHPKRLRNPGDGAKLLSSNDTGGYTFLGRFQNADQALSVGFDVTQKAHNALRWLIGRQSYRNGDQCIVCWSIGGEAVPDPFMDSWGLMNAFNVPGDPGFADTAQVFALRLRRSLAGYSSKLDPGSDIVVMGLDSTSGMKGRMAITYYRELKGSEFLGRIEAWHTKVAWHQNFGKDSHFVGAPSPRDIVEAAFGRRVDDRLLKATIERLLPCIVDGQGIPHDLVVATSRRASNRSGFKSGERWVWEKCLGIACALFKGYHTERDYQMALEPNRTTRDYLYGRLLAIAEDIESRALFVAKETRDTNAARLMQRFADHPFSTWKTIELSLVSYRARLRSKRGAWLFGREQLLDEVMSLFNVEDYTSEVPLSGEFLLGYHCQRRDLASSKTGSIEADANTPQPDSDE